MSNEKSKYNPIIKGILAVLIAFFLLGGFSVVWAVTLPIPDFNTYFQNLSKTESTKIYDRSGTHQLYNLSGLYQRTQIPLGSISRFAKQATIAIEDDKFYQHNGVEISSILRAVFADLKSGQLRQGGSTITQQVVKNTLLSGEKTFTRKIKEAVLAIKLEKTMSKDQILELYLNQIPYGGNIYGIEEASQTFFKKKASDLTLAEAAYLAAIPQAPTTYSPYGTHRDRLEARKNLVLDKMVSSGYIAKSEADNAKKEKVAFAPMEFHGLNAPHFVFFVKSYLEDKYGPDVDKMGLKVYTTLDWDIEQKAEATVKKYAEENEKKFKASNAAMVAIDPKTGQILAMVGSRDYFDAAHEGNFNVALAHRQPGSSFKPIVYATAFNEGYTPETVLFDVPTEFNPSCPPSGTPGRKAKECYMPVNFDDKFMGPMTLRNALAQSRNIPAVKLLYLAGVNNALDTARKMGITSLKDKNTYGLTLVLGGGEVSLLEMTDAYGVFANDGVREPYTGILKVVDAQGKTLEEYKESSEQVLPANTARQISSILSDNDARTPTYGANSPLYFPGRDVAAKTGTSNDYRDTWIIGYTPNLVVGAWAGNNNNSPIDKKVAGMVVAPMWGDFMRQVVPGRPNDRFADPDPSPSGLKPVLSGVWQGGNAVTIDKATGQAATDLTPMENREIRVATDVHSILYWVNKGDPRGPAPSNPGADGQFGNWEYGVRQWAATHGYAAPSLISIPASSISYVRSNSNQPVVRIVSPAGNASIPAHSDIALRLAIQSGSNPIQKTELYVNRSLVTSQKGAANLITFGLDELASLKDANELTVVVYDSAGNKAEDTVNFQVSTTTTSVSL